MSRKEERKECFIASTVSQVSFNSKSLRQSGIFEGGKSDTLIKSFSRGANMVFTRKSVDVFFILTSKIKMK